MPPKMQSSSKKGGSRDDNSPSPTSGVGGSLAGWDLSDPVTIATGIVDKKARNLEKRKNKLVALKQNMESGAKVDPDQKEAVSKLGEVSIQLDLVRDLQKQFTSVNNEYQKQRKRQQKLEKAQQKEMERDNMRKVLGYSFGVYHLLDSFDDVAKEHFSEGSNGAVSLTETELGNLDSLYRLLAPSRAGNPSYQSDLLLTSDHLLLLFEQSSKEVIGTNYKELHELLKKIESCDYFDKNHEDEEEEEEDEEEEEEEEERDTGAERLVDESHDSHVISTPSAEAVSVPDHVTFENGYREQPSHQQQDEEMGGAYIQQPSLPTTQEQMAQPANTSEPPPVMEYMPSSVSVPSPTFPGLGLEGVSPVAPGTDVGFSFMHDSEVSRPPPTAPTTSNAVTTQPHAQILPQPTPTPPPTQQPLTNLPQAAHISHPPPPPQPSQFAQSPSYQAPPTNLPATPPAQSSVEGVKVFEDGSTGYQSKTDATTGQASPSPFQPKKVVPVSGQHSNSQDFVTVGGGGGRDMTQQSLPREQQGPRDDGFQQQRYGSRGNQRGSGGRGGGWRGGGRGGQRYGRGGGGNGRNYGNQQGGAGGGGRGGYGGGYGGGRGRGGYGERRGGGRPNYQVQQQK